jgi:hypothetical protein
MMQKVVIVAVAIAMALGAIGETRAEANDAAPCIGENASGAAPILRGDFGQVVVAPEARAGETGEVASGAARSACN